MVDTNDLTKALKFLNSIGITLIHVDLPTDTFIPGMLLKNSQIFCDASKLECVGDLFHEVGHWAVTLGCYRDRWNGNNFDLPDDEFHRLMENRGHNENPLFRQVIDGDEQATIAWSYAAAVACGVDPEKTHLNQHFDGDWSEICAMLRMKCHAGINNMVRIGMLESRDRFPVLQKWVQE